MANFLCLDENFSTTRLLTKEKPEVLKNPDDQFETVLFLPEGENRCGEGGLRTKGYFKQSYPDKPLISIITVVYNGEKYLEETIRSVLKQTYDNVEYIIIDGGSTDGTLDIIRKYEDQIDYWVSERDKGIYDAMNKGLKIVCGDYINFMNGGDCFSIENILSLIHERIISNNYPDFIYGDAIEVNEAKVQYYRPSHSLRRKQIGMFTHHQSMIYKHGVIRQYQLSYDTTYTISADYKFTCEFVNHSSTFCYIAESFSFFSQGGVSQLRWLQSMREQISIKREVLNMPFPKIYLIYAVQIIWHGIKDYFPWLYRTIRFRKNNHV